MLICPQSPQSLILPTSYALGVASLFDQHGTYTIKFPGKWQPWKWCLFELLADIYLLFLYEPHNSKHFKTFVVFHMKILLLCVEIEAEKLLEKNSLCLRCLHATVQACSGQSKDVYTEMISYAVS